MAGKEDSSGVDGAIVYARTKDGWQLALTHWAPAADAKPRPHPVLMVHGLGANRLNLDLDDRYSIARSASQRGFDTYVLELRGAGLSRAPDDQDALRFEWGFNEYADFDMHAAIETITERTGCGQIHGVGHSMGGMLFYCLATRQHKALRSVCAVGTPLIADLQLRPSESRLLKLATKLAPESSQRRVPLRKLMGAAQLLMPVSKHVVDGLLLNLMNTDDDVVMRMSREGIDDVPLQLILELTQQMAKPSADGPYAYESLLNDIDVPVLAIGGSVDRIAPPASARAATERINSRDVRYREMGTAHGDQADYGHVDLLVGRHAPKEVFPLVLDFLEEMD